MRHLRNTPTSATAAIMLSAFQSYGINPGPLLLESQAQLVWGGRK